MKNNKIRIAIIAGIRSQFIKTCAFQTMYNNLSDKIKNRFDLIYIDSGQHYDYELSNGFMNELNIHFDYRLKHVEKKPIGILAEMIVDLSKVLVELESNQKLDYVIVFGDANTTMAGSIATSKLDIKLIHVEAGLRLGSFRSPEEGNRIIADHFSAIRFVSNTKDFNSLKREGLLNNSYYTGDIIYDLVLHLGNNKREYNLISCLRGHEKINYECDNFVIASMHREENIKAGNLSPFFKSLNDVEGKVLFIAHPRIEDKLNTLDYNKEKITIVDYIPYKDMLFAMSKSSFIMTDSGAFQREAYYLGKRCLVRQDVAFWQVLVEEGIHRLIGGSYKEMVEGIRWVQQKNNEKYPIKDISCFGDGNAVRNILTKIIEIYG